MIRRLAAVYGVFWAVITLIAIFMGKAWFFSSQVAFLGSLLILAAGFRAYRNRVLSQVPIEREKLGNFNYDDDYYDIDALGLKFYPNDDAAMMRTRIFKPKFYFDARRNLAAQNLDFKEMLRREKELAKRKKGAKFSHIQTAFVPFRLIAYAVLAALFLALNRNGLFDPAAFLIALGIMPVGAIIFGVMSRND